MADVLKYARQAWDDFSDGMQITPVYTTDGSKKVGFRYSYGDYVVYLYSGWENKIGNGAVIQALDFWGAPVMLIVTANPSQVTKDGKTLIAVPTKLYKAAVPTSTTPTTTGVNTLTPEQIAAAAATGTTIVAPPTAVSPPLMDQKITIGGRDIPVIWLAGGALALYFLTKVR